MSTPPFKDRPQMFNRELAESVGAPQRFGKTYYVDGTNGANSKGGRTWDEALATVAAAVALLASGDRIVIAPGEYDEAITIPRTLNNISLIGTGGRGAAFIAPSTAAAVAVTNHADDVTIDNVGLDGNTTGAGLINSGSRLRVYRSKLEGDDIACQMLVATIAQEAADTRGTAGDILFEDCEFAWATTGLLLTGSDYGAVTQMTLRGCRFHNHSAASIEESHGAGGGNTVHYRNLVIDSCVFDDAEDGTAPTKYVSLNDDNANSGIVANCSFPTAINSGLNLVSTALHWVSNRHTGGVSTAQPS